MTTENLAKKIDEKARGGVRSAVAAILEAKGELDAEAASGTYSEAYLERQRRERAEGVASTVSRHLQQAAGAVEKAQMETAGAIEATRDFEPAELAAATVQLQMVLGDSLRQDPESILRVYEASFDNAAERRVLEDIGEKLFRMMPDNPVNQELAGRFQGLQVSLLDRLPEDSPERVLNAQAQELEETASYLQNAAGVLNSDLDRLAGEERPRAASVSYTTSRHAATRYEAARDENSESAIADLPSDWDMAGNVWGSVSPAAATA